MEVWETIRLRCRRDGEKIKPVARDLSLAPNTVRKYLRQDAPPTRTAKPRPRLLDRYASHIDELLRSTPKITAVRVGSYLRTMPAPSRSTANSQQMFCSPLKVLCVEFLGQDNVGGIEPRFSEMPGWQKPGGPCA
ncbi:MAG: hypothetical protein ACR2IV_19085 [Bryobacteraceae bacterium]